VDSRFWTKVTSFIFYVFPMSGSLKEAYVEEPSRPGCDAVSFGEQFPMLQWILVRSGLSRLRRIAVLLGLLKILNIKAPWSEMLNYSPNDTPLYPRRPESPATLLWEYQILQACVAVQSGYNPGYLKTISSTLHKSVSWLRTQFLRRIFTCSPTEQDGACVKLVT